MDGFDDYLQVINIATPAVESLGSPALSKTIARLGNQEMAKLVDRYPERFIGFTACLPMDDVAVAIEEYQFATQQLGAKGAQIYTNVQGMPMDRPELDPLYEVIAASGGVLQVHPCRNSTWPDYPSEERSKFEAWWSLGWETDLSVFMVRIVCSGVLERFPSLKLLIHHGGSMIPHFAGRLNEGLSNIGARTPEDENEDVADYDLTRPAIDYFKMMYADTSLSGCAHAMRCSKSFYGTDHIVFGTDMPYGPEGGAGYIRDAIEDVKAVAEDEEDAKAMFYANSVRLFDIG